MATAGAILLLGTVSGCSTATSVERPKAAPPEVVVSVPVRREIKDYAEYTGRTAAVDSVELRARVSGYLTKVNFEAGQEVAQGRSGSRTLGRTDQEES